MARDNIELVDEDYLQCPKVSMPRQIRLRDSSFHSIFSEFKKKLYERKMSKVIESTLSDEYTDDSLKSKLMISSKKIASLDSKIKRLSKDSIPEKNVGRRAIKLRNLMMKNARVNADGYYKVDLLKDDVVGLINSIDGKEKNNKDVISIDEMKISDSDTSDYVDLYKNVSDSSIIGEVEDSDTKTGKSSEPDSNVISDEEAVSQIDISLGDVDSNSIGKVINEEFANIENKNPDGVIVDDVTDSEDTKDKENSNEETNNNINLPLNDVDINSINDSINEEFANLDQKTADTNTTFVSPEEVSKVVKSNFIGTKPGKDVDLSSFVNYDESTNEENDSISNEKIEEEIKNDNRDDNVVLSNDDSSDVNNEMTSNGIVPGIDEINLEKIHNEINNAIDNIKLSKSESSIAKIDKFDENGNIRFKDTYSPMSDDEIADSQEKINSLPEYEDKSYVLPSGSIFDKKLSFSNLFIPVDSPNFTLKQNDKVEDERDVPVVVADRDNIDLSIKKSPIDDEIEEYEFSIDNKTSEVKADDSNSNDIGAALSQKQKENRKSEFEILKERILKLKKKQAESNENMLKVQNSVVETAKQAEEAKKQAVKIQGILDCKIEELREFCDGLEKHCDETIKETSIMENDIQMNRNFIQFQNGHVKENEKLIEEINNFISGGNENNHSIKK